MAKPHGRDTDGTPIYFCIWCGSRDSLTREHVLAKKWRKYLGSPDSPQVSGGWQLDSTWKPRYINRVKPRQGAFTWTVPRLVCGSCNNGWMSRLEDAVEPFLLPAVQGRAITWDAEQQSLLLNWLAKTVIVMEFMDGQPKTFDVQLLAWLRSHIEDGVTIPGFVASVSRLELTTMTDMRSTPFSRVQRGAFGQIKIAGTTRVASIQLGGVGLTTYYSSGSDSWSATTEGSTLELLSDGWFPTLPQQHLTVAELPIMTRLQHFDRHSRLATKIGEDLGALDPRRPEIRLALGLDAPSTRT